jgi:hypothetical protein
MSRNIDITKFKKSAKEQAEAKNKRFSSYLVLPEGVEKFEIGDAKKGEDMVKKDISIVMYKQTKDKNESGYDYKRSYKVHNNLGVDGKTSVVCPTTFGKPCPICELRKEMGAAYDTMTEAEKKVYNNLKARSRSLYNVIEGGKVKIFDSSDFTFQDRLDEELRAAEDDDYYAFAQDEGGYTLKARFTKEKKGAGMVFYNCSAIQFKPREDLDEDIFEQVQKLDEMLVIKSYDELSDLLNGTDTVTEEEEEEEKPAVSSKRKAVEEDDEEDFVPVKKKKVVVEEEDDAPWGDDDEEEEVVRRPKRRVIDEDDED